MTDQFIEDFGFEPTEGRGTQVTTIQGTGAVGDTLWINADTHNHPYYATDGLVQGIDTSLSENVKISHKFRWIKEGNKKVLQCHENDEWVTIPFIEDPDKDLYPEEINDLCSMG